jgi:hypothetical protein
VPQVTCPSRTRSFGEAHGGQTFGFLSGCGCIPGKDVTIVTWSNLVTSGAGNLVVPEIARTVGAIQ